MPCHWQILPTFRLAIFPLNSDTQILHKARRKETAIRHFNVNRLLQVRKLQYVKLFPLSEVFGIKF